jgi:hypothetical protein
VKPSGPEAFVEPILVKIEKISCSEGIAHRESLDPFHNFTTPLPSLLIIFFLLPLSTRSFFFRKCFHENERERARQGAARKEEHERESGLKKLVQIK